MPTKKRGKSSGNGTTHSDPLINGFVDQFEQANGLMAQGTALRQMVKYIKKRYGNLAEFSEIIEPRVAELETQLLKQYNFCSSVIGDVRRAIKHSGRAHGTGLRRKPTGDELAEVRKFRGPQRVASVEDIGEISADLS